MQTEIERSERLGQSKNPTVRGLQAGFYALAGVLLKLSQTQL